VARRWSGPILLAALLAAGCRPAAPAQPAPPPEPAAAEVPADDEEPLSAAEEAAAAYGAGLEAEAAGDAAGAAECYRRGMELEPGQAECRLRLGLLLVKQPAAAAEGAQLLERAAAQGQRSFALHEALAAHYLQTGRKERAAREFEKLLSCAEAVQDPERFEPVAFRVAFYLVNYYQVEGQPAAAARVYTHLTRRFPDRADFRLERAKLLLAAGNEAEARSEVAAYEQRAPESASGARLLAVHFARRGADAEALVETERAIARLRADRQAVPGDLAAMRHFRAELLGRLKRFAEARRELSALLAAAADDGERVDALVALAHLERAAGRPEQAARQVRAALDSGLKSARLNGALAEALADSGDAPGAVEAYRRAEEIAPADNYYRLALAALFAKLGRRAEAAAELRAALKSAPDDPAALNMLAYLYAQEGLNLDEAADLAGRALAAEKDNGHYLDTLGWVRYRQGKVAEALPLLERAALNAPEAVIHEHLGDACYALGLLRRARAAWTRARELDPGLPGPPRKLKRLRP
jgi:tetratricopeptide (TPR) repeat protein